VSFLSTLFLPPFYTSSHSFFFQLNYYPFSHAGCLPSVHKSNKFSCCHPLLACHMEKAVTVSSPLIPPLFCHFSQTQFNYYPSAMQAAPSLSQSKEQRPATTIPTSEVCGEGGDIEFSFCFFFTISNVFSQHFFQLNCYLVGGWVLLFFVFISPPHLNFTMSYIPIKICQPKLLFCVVN